MRKLLVALMLLLVSGCGADERQMQAFLEEARSWHEQATLTPPSSGLRLPPSDRLSDIANRRQPSKKVRQAQTVVMIRVSRAKVSHIGASACYSIAVRSGWAEEQTREYWTSAEEFDALLLKIRQKLDAYSEGRF